MTPGYITLDRLHEITRDVTGWRAAHPHLIKHDMSEPSTAEVMTVSIDRRRGTTSTVRTSALDGPQPHGYRGLRRRPQTRSQHVVWSMMVGGGLMLVFLSVIALGALAAWQVIIPTLFGH